MAMTPATADRLGLPPGGLVALPGRRTVFVRDTGPSSSPALLLLPGLTLSCDLNWFGVFAPLAEHFRVIAMDLPGQGRSPAGAPLSLDESADDASALIAALGLRKVIPVGYSMGGLVAQLLWRRHREQVAGLVLCSTARNFRGSPLERLASLSLPGLSTAVGLNPFLGLMGSGHLGSLVLGHVRDPAVRLWAMREMDRTNVITTMRALREVSAFSSHDWIASVDVPTAVVVTGRDQVIPASRQWRLARAVPRAHVTELDDDHGVCVNAPDRFAAAVLGAARVVARTGQAGTDLPAGRKPVL